MRTFFSFALSWFILLVGTAFAQKETIRVMGYFESDFDYGVPKDADFQYLDSLNLGIDFISHGSLLGLWPSTPNATFRSKLYSLLQKASQHGKQIIFHLNPAIDIDQSTYAVNYSRVDNFLDTLRDLENNNPNFKGVVYGFLVLDEPDIAHHLPESLIRSIFNHIEQKDNHSHVLMDVEPVGFCDVEKYPYGFCSDRMIYSLYANPPFDILLIDHFPVTREVVSSMQEDKIENFMHAKLNGFISYLGNDYPGYPIMPVLENFYLTYSEYPYIPVGSPFGAVLTAEMQGYRSVPRFQCLGNVGFFFWNIGPGIASLNLAGWPQQLQSSELVGIMDDEAQNSPKGLLQELINFMDINNGSYWQSMADITTDHISDLSAFDSVQILMEALPPFCQQLENWEIVQVSAAVPSCDEGQTWLSINNQGLFSLNPTKVNTYEVTIGYSCGQCIDEDTYTIHVKGPMLTWGGVHCFIQGSNVQEVITADHVSDNYEIILMEGNLPSGLSIQGHILEGTPTEAGIFPLKMKVYDGPCNQSAIEDVVFVITEDCNGDNFIYPTEGTVVGGTVVQIVSSLGDFQGTPQVGFDFHGDGTCEDFAMRRVMAQRVNPYVMSLQTPQAPEGVVDVALDTNGDGTWDRCIPFGYTFKTLAFTSNQVSQNISIIDTVENQLFSIQSFMDFPGTPGRFAMNKGSREGRYFYVIDEDTGNLRTFDGANFINLGETVIQDPATPYTSPGAFDITTAPPVPVLAPPSTSSDTQQMPKATIFVSHLTSGQESADPETGTWQLAPIPGGGVSVLTATTNPQLIDVDNNSNTNSPGAPQGITRIGIPLYSPPENPQFFHPLSIQAVQLPAHPYEPGDKIPGSYIFVSGVSTGILKDIYLCGGPFCSPGPIIVPAPEPCPKGCDVLGHGYHFLEPRDVLVAIIDNNPWILSSDKSYQANPDYWRRSGQAYKVMGGGVDGTYLGQTTQPLAFFAGRQMDGLPPTVYMANEHENQLYIFQYDDATKDWHLLKDDAGNPITIPTNAHPTDVKVQDVPDVTTPDPSDFLTLAYVTLAGSLENPSDTVDQVMVIETATNTELPFPQSPIEQDQCYNADHYPTAFDTRSVGDRGYSADYLSNTVTVFDLPNSTCQQATVLGAIAVGEAPRHILVQPVPSSRQVFYQVYDSLGGAPPESFTQPAKKDNLMRDWIDVQELQETSANPQAVVSNIDAFQGKVNQWVVDEDVKTSLNDDIDLYRTIYVIHHPLPGNH